MFVSWRWISQWVDTQGVDPVAFAQRFTCTVAEIDKVHDIGKDLSEVRVADIMAVTDHPAADKLHLATVDLGALGQVTVVCGAPGLVVGMRVPFVPPGVTLPSGITVRDGEVRGVPSPGMLASEADLGLSDDHSGLLSLDGCHAPAGTRLPDAVQVRDVLYEVDNKSITHRPDLWGQYGMAREIAAMLGLPLLPLELDVELGHGAPLDIAVLAPELCPRYVCARMTDIVIAPAPVDLRLRLRRLGVRPINNVVDATNLVMLETGNPLHAFDARSLRGEQIRVRRAQPGETLTTLDGQVRTLLPSDCVIADGQGAVALAGVMGGADSEIKDDTVTLILEAAAFDAATIRKTAMRLGMRTESSARFEKALDPALPGIAARRFLRLVGKLSPGARVSSELADAGPFRSQPPHTIHITTTLAYLRERLGVSAIEMPDAWIEACLQRLDFRILREEGALHVSVPTWRATKDVSIAEDLVEELGRHFGYGNIHAQAPLIPSKPPFTPPLRLLERQVRALLVEGAGLTEVLTYAFDHEGDRARLGLSEGELPRLGVRNAISSEHKYLRRNLAPNLIAALGRNLQQGDGRQATREGLQIGLFEIGRVFVPVPDRELTAAEQHAVDRGVPDLALALHGDVYRRSWLARMTPDMAQAVDKATSAGSALPWQPMRLCVAIGERLGGAAEGGRRVDVPREVSERLFRQAVGIAESVLDTAGRGSAVLIARAAPNLSWPVAPPDAAVTWLHPAREALLTAGNGQVIGHLALIHPSVRQQMEVAADLLVIEIDLGAVLALPEVRVQGKEPDRFPASTLDVTFPVHPGAKYAEIVGWTRAFARPRLGTDVQLAFEFVSEHRPVGGQRAITLRLHLRAPDRTLSAEDLKGVSGDVVVAAFLADAAGVP